MINTQDIIKQLSSPTKINIICWVMKKKEGMRVGEISELTGLARTNISKQINEMKNMSLLKVSSQGRENFYTLSSDLHPEQVKMINALVNSFHYIDEGKTDHEFY